MSCAEFAVSWWSHRLSSASASVHGKNYEVGTIMVPGSRDLNNLSLPSPPKHTPRCLADVQLYFGMSWEKHVASVTDLWAPVGERHSHTSNVAHLNFQMKAEPQGKWYRCEQLDRQRLFIT